MNAFHIKAWDLVYETSETRKIRTLTYYAKPNKLVGEGIGYTLAQPDGPHLLGMWALIEALASTSPQDHRGWLVRNGTALDAARMANLTRVGAEHFERALEFFCRPQIAWLESIELPGHSAGKKPETAGHPESPGAPPGDSPGENLNGAGHPESPGPISARGKIDQRGKTDKGQRERDKRGGEPLAATPQEQKQQQLQWAATNRRIQELNSVPEEDRSEEQEAELKKMRALIRQIEKKQRAGDFRPVKEGKA